MRRGLRLDRTTREYSLLVFLRVEGEVLFFFLAPCYDCVVLVIVLLLMVILGF